MILRQYLKEQGKWPLAHCVLVAYENMSVVRESRLNKRVGSFCRASLSHGDWCFEPIVSRLWYYNHPWLHQVYEQVATALTRVRLL